MNISGASLGLPGGIAGWKLLQTRQATDFAAITRDAGLKGDIAYLRAKLPSKLTAKSLLADPRLEQIVLTAYGLTAQIGMGGLMEKVLNSDIGNRTSLARKMTNAVFTEIAGDFNYGSSTARPAVAAMPSEAEVAVEGLQPGQGFDRFAGRFGGVTLRDVDVSGATSREQLAATLQAAFRRADGNRGDISVTVQGTSLVFKDAKGRGAAQELMFGPASGATARWVPAGTTSASGLPAASEARITVGGLLPGQTLGNVSGSFGGVTLTALDTSAAGSRQQLAATLQAAFRKADGDRSDITVTAYGNELILKDAKGRGGATGFSFAQTPGGATAALTRTTMDGSGVLQAAVAPTASTAQVAIEGLSGTATIASFSGSFGGVTLSRLDTSAATSWTALASTLQDAFRKADGGRADISVTASGHNLVFTDNQGSGGAKDFTFESGGKVTAKVTANSGEIPFSVTPTSSTLAIAGLDAAHGFARISGSFGGIGVGNLDISAATTREELASTLQAAFRAADANRPFISVTVSGNNLVFTDARGRGGAEGFTLGEAGGATARVVANAAGRQAVAASGGPKVTDSAFVEKLVARYTQARFQEAVGDVSESLRKALYAREKLPKATNWYSILADGNQAAVVRGALGLPDSFAAVDVDQQVNILKSKMKLADFKDPAKLDKFLERYVTLASIEESSAVSDPTGMLQLFQPPGGGDSIAGAASAAIFGILFQG